MKGLLLGVVLGIFIASRMKVKATYTYYFLSTVQCIIHETPYKVRCSLWNISSSY